jgi:hypothetical protein
MSWRREKGAGDAVDERGGGGERSVEGRLIGEMASTTLWRGDEMRRQPVVGWLCGKSRRRLCGE